MKKPNAKPKIGNGKRLRYCLGRKRASCNPSNLQLPEKECLRRGSNKVSVCCFDSIDALIEQPERYGYDRILLENPPRYRSIPIGGYRVVYEFKAEVIYVLLVYHSRQNPEKIKKEML